MRGDTHKILIVGGGRTGGCIARLLQAHPRFSPFVLDIDYDCVRALKAKGISADHMSGAEADRLARHLQGAAAVICAAPPSVAPIVARGAAQEGCAYLDLCEDPKALSEVARIAQDAQSPFVSGCGLAPGLISLMVEDLALRSPKEAEITAYVGVLPAQKRNRLGYGDMWDIQALLSEYTNPCVGLSDGALVTVPPLTGYETLTVAGANFEAFTTSGALDALVPGYAGRLKGLSFKTLRYPGHLDYISFLLDDLGLSKRLYMLRNLLLTGLERVEADKVIVHLVCRHQDGEKTLTKVFDGGDSQGNSSLSALAHISASHACAVLELLTTGAVQQTGLLHPKDMSFDLMAKSTFAKSLVGGLVCL